MEEKEDIITLRIKKSKVRAFVNMLKLFDFIKLTNPDEKIDRYINSAPKDIPVSDEEIMELIKSHPDEPR